VRVETKILELSLRNEVLKRELIEGEEADLAASRVKKALRAAARQKRSVGKIVTSAPLAVSQQAPPANASSSPPAVQAAAAAGKLP
jgi:hypothetical protein